MTGARPTGRGRRALAARALAAMAAFAASVAFAHGALDEQIAKATADIARDPADARLYVRRGELLRVHEEWDAALADYARARALSPGDDTIDFLRGRALQEAGRAAAAKQALDAYLERHPAHVEALTARGRAEVALGEPAAAAGDFTRAIERASKPDPELYAERARAQLAAGRTAQAIAGLDEGIARLGPIASLELLAIEIETRQGETDRALARIDALAARSPRKETWLARRGDILAQAGRRDEARVAYANALSAIETLPAATRGTKAVVDLEGKVREALAGR